jgi:foldase protein PrsA
MSSRNLRITFAIGLLAAVLAAVPASAAGNTPLAEHNGVKYVLDDFHIFFMRQLGARGLVTFLEQAIVYEEATKVGLTPTDAERSKFIQENMSQEIYDGFKQLYPQDVLSRFVDYTIMNRKFQDYLEAKFIKEKNIVVTDDDANKYYLQNIKVFQPPERVWMSIISVETLETAKEVLAKLDKGENFNELASVYNSDPELRARAGYVGVMERGAGLPAPIEEAAFALSPDKYSQVIKGTLFHVLYVHDKRPAELHEFAEVKDEIKATLRDMLVQNYIDEYLNELYTRELPKFDIRANLFNVGEGETPTG